MFLRGRSLVLIAVATLAFFSFSKISFAQLTGNTDISITTSPTNPGPDESVTVSLTSYSTDLSSSDIEWTVDGQKVLGGIGDDHYTLTTKDLGVSTTVDILIIPEGELPIEKSLVITPMSVDMLWEATDSIVPPLYRGKAMPTSESDVEFVAIPQIKSSTGDMLGADQFVYEWQQNYNADQTNSGYGKNSAIYQMDDLNPTMEVMVDVTSRDGSTTAEGNMELSPSTPKLIWYASSPLYGALYDNALIDDYTVKDPDVSLLAEPYFFSPGDASSDQLDYTWGLNGNTITTPSIPNTLFLHRSDTTTGDATVSLSVTNVTKLFQEASAQLTLHLQ